MNWLSLISSPHVRHTLDTDEEGEGEEEGLGEVGEAEGRGGRSLERGEAGGGRGEEGELILVEVMAAEEEGGVARDRAGEGR